MSVQTENDEKEQARIEDKVEKIIKKLNNKQERMPESVGVFLLFIGGGRTGHSFFGQCLNAHPDCLIGNEGVLRQVAKKTNSADLIYTYVKKLDAGAGRRGYVKDFSRKKNRGGDNQFFLIPNGFQGKTDNPVVIGTSKAGYTTRWLCDDFESFRQFEKTMGLPIKFIFQKRHPASMVLSMEKRRFWARDLAVETINTKSRQLNALLPRLRSEYGVFEFCHEDFLGNPAGVSNDAFDFLGLERNALVTEGIREATVNKELSDPLGAFDPDLQDQISEIIFKYPFFEEYRT